MSLLRLLAHLVGVLYSYGFWISIVAGQYGSLAVAIVWIAFALVYIEFMNP